MAWQKYSIQFILGLPLSLPIATYAIDVGETQVQSQQNQPLNASIELNNVDVSTFSVKPASDNLYQQLGLTKTANVNARFEPTGKRTGKIILTSNQPIEVPFADVVLDVTENGQSRPLPKTLLLPISSDNKLKTKPVKATKASQSQVKLIGTGAEVKLPVMGQPLIVNNSEPPAMVDPTIMTQPVLEKAPIVVEKGGINLPATSSLPTTPSPETIQTLTIQETRRVITPTESTNSSTQIASSTATSDSQASLANNTKPTATSEPTNEAVANVPTATTESTEDTHYVVQRNENLWTIANKIATEQKTDINKVMQAIVVSNPSAFINQDPTKLIYNSTLTMPTNYEVTPSQTSVKAATTIKRRVKPVTTKKSTQRPQSNHTASKKSQTVTKPARSSNIHAASPVTRLPRRTEMKIVAPSQANGNAQGTSDKDGSIANQARSSQVVAQVQKKRVATAQQATKVKQLNQNLVSAEQRLKLQNAKLAQLEQRLKQLNGK